MLRYAADTRGADVVGVGRALRPEPATGSLPYASADLADPEATSSALKALRPDVVIHAAARSDLDACEAAPDLAWRDNLEATRVVAACAAEVGARLVVLSTDCVFDGEAERLYTEDDAPRPTSIYAASKLASEHAALALCPRTAVARTATVFGTSHGGRDNAVTGLLRRLRASQRATMATDQVRTPVLLDNLVEMLWALAVDDTAGGIYHTVGATVLSRYELAVRVAERFGYDPSLIQPVLSAQLQQSVFRPLRTPLATAKLRARFKDLSVLEVDAALDRFADSLSAPAVFGEGAAHG